MTLLTLCGGEPLVLDDVIELGAGASGLVVASPRHSEFCFKIYVNLDQTVERRITALLRLVSGSHDTDPYARVAWPRECLRNEKERVCGIVLPRAHGVSAYALFSPARRVEVLDDPTWVTNLRVAARVADLVDRVHSRGFVVGDLSPANLVIDRHGRVALIDCDGMQFIDPAAGERFGAANVTPEYCSPEAVRTPGRWLTREHDHFGLALLIWQLLLDGDHPYEGVPARGPDEGVAGNILAGACRPFRPELLKPVAAATGLLPPRLLELARRTFVDGHVTPARRTTAAAWAAELRRVECDLVTCPRTRDHVYPAETGACPWCGGAQATPEWPAL
jgi:DNA-binding helix-hairpin-helix protein with protein kinase domain